METTKKCDTLAMEPVDNSAYQKVPWSIIGLCSYADGRNECLVNWLGRPESENSWEPEEQLYGCRLLRNECIEKIKEGSKADQSKPQVNEEEDGDIGDVVEKIAGFRFYANGTKEYLIKWLGYPENENTWEPEQNLDCDIFIYELMQEIKKRNDAKKRQNAGVIIEQADGRLCEGKGSSVAVSLYEYLASRKY